MVGYQPRFPAIQVIGSCLSMITSKQYGTVQDTKRKNYKYNAIKQYGITALAGSTKYKMKKIQKEYHQKVWYCGTCTEYGIQKAKKYKYNITKH